MTQKRKDKKAAMRFFKKLLKELKGAPVKVVMDKLRSYSAAQRNLISSGLFPAACGVVLSNERIYT